MARDENSALIIALRKKVLGLPRQVLPAPRTVATVTTESDRYHNGGYNEASSPPLIELAPLDGAHIPEAIVIS